MYGPYERCLRFVTAFAVRTDRKSKLRTESLRLYWTCVSHATMPKKNILADGGFLWLFAAGFYCNWMPWMPWMPLKCLDERIASSPRRSSWNKKEDTWSLDQCPLLFCSVYCEIVVVYWVWIESEIVVTYIKIFILDSVNLHVLAFLISILSRMPFSD